MPDPVALLAVARTPFAPPGQPQPDRAALAASAVNAAIGRARLDADRPAALILACGTADAAGGLAGRIARQTGLTAATGCASGTDALAQAWQALRTGRCDDLLLAGLGGDSPDTPDTGQSAAAGDTRARRAIDEGRFTWEIVPLQSDGGWIDRDILPAHAGPVEGAAALLLGREAGHRALARIVALTVQDAAAGRPCDTAACEATLAAAGWSADQVELWALDERRAGLVERVRERFALPDARINPDGGNLAFGDAGPADALRQLIGLVGALRRQGRRRGLLYATDPRQVLALAVEFEARIACGGRVPASNPAGA